MSKSNILIFATPLEAHFGGRGAANSIFCERRIGHCPNARMASTPLSKDASNRNYQEGAGIFMEDKGQRPSLEITK